METEPRGLAVNTFKEVLQGREVFFYVLRLQQSFLLWVGGSDGEMEVLAVAMNTPHVCNKTLHIACLYFSHEYFYGTGHPSSLLSAHGHHK